MNFGANYRTGHRTYRDIHKRGAAGVRRVPSRGAGRIVGV